MFHQKRKGSALVVVIMILAVFSILSLSLLDVALADTKNAIHYNSNTQAHYVARSGIISGLKSMDKIVSENPNLTVAQLVDTLNTYASTSSNLKNLDFKDSEGNSIAKYSISYELFSPTQIKTICDSQITNNPNSRDKVTLIVTLKTGSGFYENPDEWINGKSQTLSKGVSTTAHKDHKVKLTGKGQPIKLPENSGGGKKDSDNSTYIAKYIYFTDNGGYCFKQLTNVVQITFNVQVLYFETALQVQTVSPTDPVYFKYLPSVPAPDTTHPNDGFENQLVYNAFIGSSSYILSEHYASGTFDSTQDYGVVYIGSGGITDSHGNPVCDAVGNPYSGYYYFRSGMNLTNIKSGDLIKINADDPIISCIDKEVKPSVDRTGRIWNKS